MNRRHKVLKKVKATFKDVLGWTAETNERGTGFNIYNHEGREVAHYILRNRSLWLHPINKVIEVRECRTLQQAVRYAYLKTLQPISVPEVKS